MSSDVTTSSVDVDSDPEVTSRLSGSHPEVTIRLSGSDLDPWRIPKSTLVECSGFFRRMFRHDCKESRDNSVLVHDDDPEALDLLLRCFTSVSIHFFDPFWHHEHVDMFVQLHALVLKYDCPRLERKVLDALAACIRHYWDTDPRLRPRWPQIFNDHVDVVTNNNGGDYPVEMAPAIAEMWAGAEKDERDPSEPMAFIESRPALAVAVAKNYLIKNIRAEHDIEAARKNLRGVPPRY